MIIAIEPMHTFMNDPHEFELTSASLQVSMTRFCASRDVQIPSNGNIYHDACIPGGGAVSLTMKLHFGSQRRLTFPSAGANINLLHSNSADVRIRVSSCSHVSTATNIISVMLQ